MVLREIRLWKTFTFVNTFSFKISVNNWLIKFTPFEQMHFPVDSKRSRFNKIRSNMLIYFATYTDICTGRGNISKYVNDNADFRWVALFILILLYLFVRISASKEAGIFIYVFYSIKFFLCLCIYYFRYLLSLY